MPGSCHCKPVGEWPRPFVPSDSSAWFVVHVWFLLNKTPANSHGVPLEDQRQRGQMFLFCSPRGQHCKRYVGKSGSPLPSTPCSHLAASPLSLRVVIVQGLYAGTVYASQRSHFLDQARAWRSSPRVGLCRVLQPQRVGVRLSLLWGRQIGTARL